MMLAVLIPKRGEVPLETAFRRAMTALAVVLVMAAAAPGLAVALAVNAASCRAPAADSAQIGGHFPE